MRKFYFWLAFAIGLFVSYFASCELVTSWTVPLVGEYFGVYLYTATYALIMTTLITILANTLLCLDMADANPSVTDIILGIVVVALVAYVGYFGIMSLIWPSPDSRNIWAIILTTIMTIAYTALTLYAILNFMEPCLFCECSCVGKYGKDCDKIDPDEVY